MDLKLEDEAPVAVVELSGETLLEREISVLLARPPLPSNSPEAFPIAPAGMSSGASPNGSALRDTSLGSPNPASIRAASSQDLYARLSNQDGLERSGIATTSLQVVRDRTSQLPPRPARSAVTAMTPAANPSTCPRASVAFFDEIPTLKSGSSISKPIIRDVDSGQSSKHNMKAGKTTVDTNDDASAYVKSMRGIRKHAGRAEDQKAASLQKKRAGQTLRPAGGEGRRSTTMSKQNRKAQAADASISAATLAQKRKADEMLGDPSACEDLQVEGLGKKKAGQMPGKPDRALRNRYDSDEGDTHAAQSSFTRLTPVPISGEGRLQWMKLGQRTRSDPEAKTSFYTPFPADAVRSNRRLSLYDEHLVAELSRGKDDATTEPDPLIKNLAKPKPLTATLYSVNGIPTAMETINSCTNAFQPASATLGTKTTAGETMRLHLQRESRRSDAKLIKSWPPPPPPLPNPAIPRTKAWVATQQAPTESGLPAAFESTLMFTPPSIAPSTPSFRHADLRQLKLEESSPDLDGTTQVKIESIRERGRIVRSASHSKIPKATTSETDVASKDVNALGISRPRFPLDRTTALILSRQSTNKSKNITERRQVTKKFEGSVGEANIVSNKGQVESAAEQMKSHVPKGSREAATRDASLDPRSNDSSGHFSDSSSTEESSADDSDDDESVLDSGPSVAYKLKTGKPIHRASHSGPQTNDSIQHQKLATNHQGSPWSGFSPLSRDPREQDPSGLNLASAMPNTSSRFSHVGVDLMVLPDSPPEVTGVAPRSAAVRNTQQVADRPTTTMGSAPRRRVDHDLTTPVPFELAKMSSAVSDDVDSLVRANNDHAKVRERKRKGRSVDEDAPENGTGLRSPDNAKRPRKQRKMRAGTANAGLEDDAFNASDHHGRLDVQEHDAAPTANVATDESNEEAEKQAKINSYLAELRAVAVPLGFCSVSWEKQMKQNLERKMEEGDKACRKYVEVKKAVMRWACSAQAPAKGKPGSSERAEYTKQSFDEKARLERQYNAEHEGSDEEDGESKESEDD